MISLFHKYLEGNYTEEELDILLEYFKLEKDSEQLKILIEQEFHKPVSDSVNQFKIKKRLEQMRPEVMKAIGQPKRRHIWWYASAAVLFFFSIAISTYVVIHKKKETQTLSSQYGDDVQPGGNKAYITLSDGSRYDLNEGQTGITIDQDGIVYDNGSLIANTGKAIEATINVPRTGTYRITLSDGTKVILNSESSLQYPTNFTGQERKVQLKGEGYFEVAHNPNRPFIVATREQNLKVLGTHFNIQAYPGEKITSTLVEGSVELSARSRKIKLSPGEQSTLEDNSFKVTEVSADEYTAWARNQFYYNLVPLREIFKQMERWYDVEIEYPKELGEEKFFMKIAKDRKLSEVLSSISTLTNIKFTIQGRSVMVRQ